MKALASGEEKQSIKANSPPSLDRTDAEKTTGMAGTLRVEVKQSMSNPPPSLSSTAEIVGENLEIEMEPNAKEMEEIERSMTEKAAETSRSREDMRELEAATAAKLIKFDLLKEKHEQALAELRFLSEVEHLLLEILFP